VSQISYDLEWLSEDSWCLTPSNQAELTWITQSLQHARWSGIRNVTACFSHILLDTTDAVDPWVFPQQLRTLLLDLKSQSAQQQPVLKQTHQLCVDFAQGSDLEDVLIHCGMTKHVFIEALTQAPLQVLVNGFAPGFSYIGHLPSALHVPRRSSPRKAVPAGSVAIADKYVAIYPQVSPGGWHIIGHCTQILFAIDRMPPNRLQVGDIVQFVEKKHEY
jgi:KipI family sensor histidine kinase inhibitor